jgi:hypothetical protein
MEYPTSGIVWSAPAVVGKSLDSVKPVTYARPFQLERLELSSPIVVELCRVDCPLLLKNLLDEVATVQVLDNQEIPGLREADAARVVSGHQDARENFVGNWIGQKFPDIAAPKDRFIETSA